jgi:hypothetical protein
MSSPKRLARIAGLLYLIVGIFGGFAIAYVTARVYVPGDAATTRDVPEGAGSRADRGGVSYNVHALKA